MSGLFHFWVHGSASSSSSNLLLVVVVVVAPQGQLLCQPRTGVGAWLTARACKAVRRCLDLRPTCSLNGEDRRLRAAKLRRETASCRDILGCCCNECSCCIFCIGCIASSNNREFVGCIVFGSFSRHKLNVYSIILHMIREIACL